MQPARAIQPIAVPMRPRIPTAQACALPGAGSLQRPFLLEGKVGDGRVLAELERPDIGRDGPTIRRLHALGKRIHRAMTVRDHVIEVLHRCLAQTLDCIGGRRREASLHDDAPPSPSSEWHGVQ